MEKRFSGTVKCGHCQNHATMLIAADFSQMTTHEHGEGPFPIQWDEGDNFEMLVCPACSGVILRKYYWHDQAMDPSEIRYEILYPGPGRAPVGMPQQIERAYEASQKVRSVDANAYAVLVGRLLELVCADRGATGATLNKKLADLATKGEIPSKLVGVVDGLRNFRNVGAHAELGDLTEAEIPILDDLCKAILEYVYSAPYLTTRAQQHLSQLKSARSTQ